MVEAQSENETVIRRDPPDFVGWKEIASFLRISVRAAQRAAADDSPNRLPIYNYGARSVAAYREELCAWVAIALAA